MNRFIKNITHFIHGLALLPLIVIGYVVFLLSFIRGLPIGFLNFCRVFISDIDILRITMGISGWYVLCDRVYRNIY